MSVLSWILFGLVAGAIAKALRPGKDPSGCFITIIIGIVGGVVGGLIGMYVLGWKDVDGWNLRSFFLAVAGSILILWLYSLVSRKK